MYESGSGMHADASHWQFSSKLLGVCHDTLPSFSLMGIWALPLTLLPKVQVLVWPGGFSDAHGPRSWTELWENLTEPSNSPDISLHNAGIIWLLTLVASNFSQAVENQASDQFPRFYEFLFPLTSTEIRQWLVIVFHGLSSKQMILLFREDNNSTPDYASCPKCITLHTCSLILCMLI